MSPLLARLYRPFWCVWHSFAVAPLDQGRAVVSLIAVIGAMTRYLPAANRVALVRAMPLTWKHAMHG
jgi:hypothetical protein